MATKSEVMKAAKSLDVRVEQSNGLNEEWLFDAPAGYVFGCDAIHTLVAVWNRDEPKADMWEDVFSRMEYGLLPCEDTRCESCEGEADIRAGGA